MLEQSILIVDDDADILGIVEEILTLEGYRVQTASNGAEALQRVGTEAPGLILLDMRMPVMDGWQFAARLRAEHNHAVPIVVMTAAKDAGERAREIRAEDYLAKPFDIEELVEKVRNHLQAR
jgi:DNA-binding response OmpR family regulator